jgi:hypothetical protein
MFNPKRKFGVYPIADYKEESILELAIALTQRRQTACQGYQIKKFTLLNDTQKPEHAQVYSLLIKAEEEGKYHEVESICFGYTTTELAEHWLVQMVNGVYPLAGLGDPIKLEIADITTHGSCYYCD